MAQAKTLNPTLLARCRFELAANFEIPALDILGYYASLLGISVKQLQKALSTAVEVK